MGIWPAFRVLAGGQIFIIFAPQAINAFERIHNPWSYLLDCEMCRNAAYDLAPLSTERVRADDHEAVAALHLHCFFFGGGGELDKLGGINERLTTLVSSY